MEILRLKKIYFKILWIKGVFQKNLLYEIKISYTKLKDCEILHSYSTYVYIHTSKGFSWKSP